MRHIFQIDAPSILHGRKITLVPFSAHRARRVIVPAASQSGDTVYGINTGEKIQMMVLRPCEPGHARGTDEMIVKALRSDERQFWGQNFCVEHFVFIGMAWVEPEDLSLSNGAWPSPNVIVLH